MRLVFGKMCDWLIIKLISLNVALPFNGSRFEIAANQVIIIIIQGLMCSRQRINVQ